MCREQGLQFRPVPSSTGGTYWSVRLPVRGPPATERFRQKSTVGGRLKKKSTVGGRLREKSTVVSQLRKKKGRRGKEEKKKRRIPRPCAVLAHAPSLHSRPLFHPRKETECLPARGERSRR
ncbi:hypothetical protein B296_00040847, partial [Ensete ventricosum]